jgi:hypothetical protein
LKWITDGFVTVVSFFLTIGTTVASIFLQ